MRERRLWPAAAVLILAVAAIYGRTVGHEFINYDDDVYIYANALVKDGLSWRGLVGAFGIATNNWHPLTWLSHMLDVQLFGLRAGGHHAVSVVLHGANGVLLLVLLRAMTGAFWRSALVAALFVVHPLRVESVAWVAERKDVLSTLFWLLTTGAYLRHARRPGTLRYLMALALFVLGLTAKPMLVTLPFTLLLLDGWPLARVPARAQRPARVAAWRGLCVEKLPFLFLSGLSVLVTLRAQTREVVPYVDPGFLDRSANAAIACFTYLRDFFWPRDLAILYPYPVEGVPLVSGVGATAALVLLTAGVVLLRRRQPFLPVGWLFYLGTLVPVIGLVQVGAQARADRYTYVPLLGFTIALVWLAGTVWPRTAAARRLLAALAACCVVALAVAASRQAARWRDSLTLLNHTVKVTRDNYIIINNLGYALAAAKRYDEAIAAFREAARINPEHCNSIYNLGYYLLEQRRPREALPLLERSLACYRRQELRLDWVRDALVNLSAANLQLGRFAEAERHLAPLLHQEPNNGWAQRMLAYARARQQAKTAAVPAVVQPAGRQTRRRGPTH